MAMHKVTMDIPPRELNRADAKFNVVRDGNKVGTLHISNGSVVWFPRYTSYGHKMRWAKFDAVMQKEGTRFEKRKKRK